VWEADNASDSPKVQRGGFKDSEGNEDLREDLNEEGENNNSPGSPKEEKGKVNKFYKWLKKKLGSEDRTITNQDSVDKGKGKEEVDNPVTEIILVQGPPGPKITPKMVTFSEDTKPETTLDFNNEPYKYRLPKPATLKEADDYLEDLMALINQNKHLAKYDGETRRLVSNLYMELFRMKNERISLEKNQLSNSSSDTNNDNTTAAAAATQQMHHNNTESNNNNTYNNQNNNQNNNDNSSNNQNNNQNNNDNTNNDWDGGGDFDVD